LHTAAINQKAEVIKVLLDNGADVNAGDNFANVYRTAKEKSMHPLDGIIYVNIIIKMTSKIIKSFAKCCMILIVIRTF